jgi:hypothetical protein
MASPRAETSAAPDRAAVREYTSFQQEVDSAEGLAAAMSELGRQVWEYCGDHHATM